MLVWLCFATLMPTVRGVRSVIQSFKLFLTLTLLFCTTTVVSVIPVPSDVPYSVIDRSSGIRKVVDDWFVGGTTRDNVESMYGLIQDWDTSEVTNMQRLFFVYGGKFKTFDADLSKWNVTKVTTMAYRTFLFPKFNSLHFFFFFLPLSLSLIDFYFFCESTFKRIDLLIAQNFCPLLSFSTCTRY